MKYSIICILILVCGCNLSKIPKEQLSQYSLDNKYEFKRNELTINLKNTLHCSVRIWIQPKDLDLKSYFDSINPITLRSLKDSIINIEISNIENDEINFASRLGDVNEWMGIDKVGLPYLKNKEYSLIQGYNSTPTHNTDWSRYALDFGLKIGDTICAATQGYVVGVIEDYKLGGKGKEWRSFANL